MKPMLFAVLLMWSFASVAQFRTRSKIMASINHTFTTPFDHSGVFFPSSHEPDSVVSPLLQKKLASMKFDNGDMTSFRSGNKMYNFSNDYKVKTTYEFDDRGNFKSSGFEIGSGGRNRRKKN